MFKIVFDMSSCYVYDVSMERRDNMARELQRLNMNMPADLIEQVDEYAEKMSLNRTSAMIVLVSTALEQKNVMGMMDNLLKEINEAKLSKK